jgi:hypothetical protein
MRTVVALLALAGLAGCQSLDVISFTATTNTVTGGTPLATETDTVTFVAVETEVNGTDNDIDGAALTDDTGATYGALQAMAPGGPYVLALTFDQINQVAPIDFTAPGGERTFIAQFHDDDSDEVTRTITLDLACRTATGLAGACDGACATVAAGAGECTTGG